MLILGQEMRGRHPLCTSLLELRHTRLCPTAPPAERSLSLQSSQLSKVFKEAPSRSPGLGGGAVNSPASFLSGTAAGCSRRLWAGEGSTDQAARAGQRGAGILHTEPSQRVTVL